MVNSDELHACNETNLKHYLSSVYSVTIPLHVAGLLVDHRQEDTIYTVYATNGTCCGKEQRTIPTRPTDSQLKGTTQTISCIYTLLPRDDGQLASLKHVDV
jgi:hypothetical protein